MSYSCLKCGVLKAPAEFRKESRVSRGHSSTCRVCENAIRLVYAKAARQQDPKLACTRRMLENARVRADKKGVAFTLTLQDIPTPDVCPALGTPLCYMHTSVQPDSPSLDRLVPALGYVPGNVAVISALANRIKNDATPGQLEAVAAWVRGVA